MNKHNITLGSDPEIFIQDEIEIVSAEGLTGGNKQNPMPITDNGHMIQEDGIMFEYNIPPCATSEEWVEHHQYVQDYLTVLAEANGYTLNKSVSAMINPIYLKSKQARTFGCEPDFNVYDRRVNQPPSNNTNLRCAGGHVAVGYPNPKQETSEKIVKLFDIFVTLPALLKDNDTRRRELYGKAGSFRFKPFGVECRALSNFWIHTEEDMKWVFDQTMKAVDIVLDGAADEYIDKHSELVRLAIDNADVNLAKVLISEIKLTEQKILT